MHHLAVVESEDNSQQQERWEPAVRLERGDNSAPAPTEDKLPAEGSFASAAHNRSTNFLVDYL